MKRIFLHIGTFKTGSTALQFHMNQNRLLLLKNGFYYGDYFDNYYLHSNLCYGLLKEALMAHGIFEKYKNHPRFLNVAEDPNRVVERIKENSLNCSNVIISCEAFFADAFRTLVGLRTVMPDEEKKEVNRFMRERLRELLLEISRDVTIVCYLRRQDLFVEAQYNQYCKNTWYGDEKYSLPSFEEFIEYDPVELNYFSVLEEWKEIFHDADFIVKPYEKAAFHNDLISDFYIDILGINDGEIEKFAEIDKAKTNQRLDRDVLEYKRHLGIHNVHVNQILKLYSEQLPQIRDYAYFSEEDRRKFMKRFSEQNKHVAKKYVNKAKEYLFEDINYSFPEYMGLENEKILEITKWLVEKLIML